MKPWGPMRRRLFQARQIAWRWWWIASGERQRVMADLETLRANARFSFDRAAEYRDALFHLNVEHRGASVDVLRKVAEQIDCGDTCEHVSPMDWSTGVRECHLSERGECPFDDASQLRDLADALEAKARVDWPFNIIGAIERGEIKPGDSSQ